MKKIIYSLLIMGLLSIGLQIFGVSRQSYVKAEQPLITHKQEVWLHTLEFCESRGREQVKIMDSNNRYSYGVLMFQMETFIREGKKYGILDENLTTKEAEKLIFSKDLQESIAHNMLLNGGERNWYNCWKIKLNKEKYPI